MSGMSSKHLPRSWSLAQKLDFRSVFEPRTFCRLWTGGAAPNGYGTLSYQGVQYYTHHAAWICAHGPIPAGLWVLHKCDVRRCINSEHLYLGTVQDNNNDMVVRKRFRPLRGERSANARFTAGQIVDIRADRRSHRAIAADYAVSHRAIGDVKNYVTWRHV